MPPRESIDHRVDSSIEDVLWKPSNSGNDNCFNVQSVFNHAALTIQLLLQAGICKPAKRKQKVLLVLSDSSVF